MTLSTSRELRYSFLKVKFEVWPNHPNRVCCILRPTSGSCVGNQSDANRATRTWQRDQKIWKKCLVRCGRRDLGDAGDSSLGTPASLTKDLLTLAQLIPSHNRLGRLQPSWQCETQVRRGQLLVRALWLHLWRLDFASETPRQSRLMWKYPCFTMT